MHLQFVGCGDAFGSGGRFNTCFHLVGRDINALIDCGASSLVAMNKLAIDRNDIDTILISHFHADHVGGLPFFMLEANYVLKRKRALTIAGPPSLKSRYGDIMETPFRAREDHAHVLSADAARTGNRQAQRDRRLHVTPFHVVHDDRAGPCLGFRFEAEGKIIAFSGDTAMDRHADRHRPRRRSVHLRSLYARQADHDPHGASSLERHLGQIRPKRLILTHMSNDMLARRAELPFETAEDGMIVEL